MIDRRCEELLALSEVPSLLPLKPNGRMWTVQTMRNWASVGVCGVVLETVYVGVFLYTSREALDRFHAAVLLARRPGRAITLPLSRSVEIADRRLDAIGI